MDTPTALATLSALKQTIDSNVIGLHAQSDALATAIQQLQGLLDTPRADVVVAQAALLVEKEKHDVDITTTAVLLHDKDVQITDLRAQIESLTHPEIVANI